MNLAGMYNEDYNSDCTTTWSPTDPLTLTIVSGSQYVSFHQRDSPTGVDAKIGSVVTTTGNDIGHYSLVADGITPDSSGDWATVQAVSDGITGTDSVQVCQLPDHFSVYTDPDTVAHSGRAYIYVQAENSAGNDIVIPWSTPLYITADDSGKYGEAYDWNNNSSPYPYGDASGEMLYNADGVEPNGVQKITISVLDANDPTKSGTGSLFIEGDIVVQVVPSEISPGDTAAITVKQRNPDGSLTDFSPNQSFEVGIDSGNAYGTILSSGGAGGYFASVSQPFQFIAADSIGADSVKAEIRVGIPNEIATSILPGRKGNSDQNMKAKHPTISINVASPKIPASRVNSVTKSHKIISDESSFTMPDYGIGYVTIKEGGPELVVIYPTDELKDEKDITKDPKMPDITTEAKLANFKGDSVHFQWNLRVQWEGDDGRQFDDSFKGNTTAADSNGSSWNINWDKIRGGDELTLDVTATASGKVYDKTINHPFIITGLNPTKEQVKNGLSTEEQVIVYMESRPKWHHFIKDHDFPIFGRPHGYGLMQLDTPPATDEQVWNWKENRAEGQRRFAEKKGLAAAHPSKVRRRSGACRYATDFTQQEYLTEAFQLYNGYYYWIWHPRFAWAPMLGGYWEKDPNLGVRYGRDYGGPAIEIYNDVVNGNPPSGW
ncbi:MAG TPA: hypothetical protein VLX91_09440 [Candidatus Acidoferrales bacterium]|nr:hypothetical protein [Candidatus Acidoferrales bacterium]